MPFWGRGLYCHYYCVYNFINIFSVNCINVCMSCLPLDTDLPPAYDIAAKLPTYEEAARLKALYDDLVSCRLVG